VLRAGQDLSIDEAMTVLAKLNRERWQEGGSSFRTDNYARFHQALARRFAERGWLWLAILTLDEKPIAARYDFVYGGKVWCMQGGWDPARQDLNPGTLMTGEVIAWAIAQGFHEYDFLGGEDHYKRRWAEAERKLIDLEAFNAATLRGRWWPRLRSLKQAWSTADAARRQRYAMRNDSHANDVRPAGASERLRVAEPSIGDRDRASGRVSAP
jgi:CelD/BcsL family acetyltransferase involved in cellulose biosynthesis